MLSAVLGRTFSSTFLLAALLGSDASRAEATTIMKDKADALSQVSPAVWERLANQRIYFGHQSVGDNILVGLREVLAARPDIKVKIQERAELQVPTKPGLFHSYVGINEQPDSKNDAFVKAVHEKLRNNVDVAFFKYCYVDITPASDAAKLFDAYRATMNDLKQKNPKIKFIHITAPLTTTQSGWKATVKKMLGKLPAGYADNAKRAEFNELMRKEYGGKEPLFDLATLEATRGDGTVSSYELDGRRYLSLAPEYSDDGGHLNATGRQYIAENLLLFLAKQVTEQRI